MNKSVFYIIFSFFISNSFAQKLEIGGSTGLTHYKGDLNQRINPLLTRPAAEVFLRYNLNRAVSVNINGIFGAVVGDDRKSNNPFNQARAYNFSNIIDNYNFQIEYNFLNFRNTSGIVKSSWTPYLFGGIGAFQLLSKTYFINSAKQPQSEAKWFSEGTSMSLPFGIGFKKVLSSKFNIGGSITINKILGARYGDSFDGFGYTKSKTSGNELIINYSASLPDKKIPNNHLNDTFYFTRFYISYVFYRTYCPPSKKLKLKKF